MSFLDNFVVKYGDYSFRGLHLKKYVKDYPWKNEKEKVEFYENLFKDTVYGKVIWSKTSKKEAEENLHILTSGYVVTKLLSYLGLGICLIGLFTGMGFVFWISFISGLILTIFSRGYSRLCSKQFLYLKTIDMWVDLIFESNKLVETLIKDKSEK